MHGRERKCVEEAPQAKKNTIFLRQNKKWCFKIAPQAKIFEYLALGIRFLLRKSSLDYVRFPKFSPLTSGIPQNFLDCPPTVGGQNFRLPPHRLRSEGAKSVDCPPTVSEVGGRYSQKCRLPPQWGGKEDPCSTFLFYLHTI